MLRSGCWMLLVDQRRAPDAILVLKKPSRARSLSRARARSAKAKEKGKERKGMGWARTLSFLFFQVLFHQNEAEINPVISYDDFWGNPTAPVDVFVLLCLESKIDTFSYFSIIWGILKRKGQKMLKYRRGIHYLPRQNQSRSFSPAISNFQPRFDF